MFSLVRIFLGEENASLSGNDLAPGCLQQTNLYTPWGGSGNGPPCGALPTCRGRSVSAETTCAPAAV